MNRHRLMHLIAVLHRVPPSQFDIHTFGYRYGDIVVADAIGHACLDPGFQDEGLGPGMYRQITPTYLTLELWQAVKAFFDIDQTQAEWLFAAHSYWPGVQPLHVAARIEETLK